MSCATKVALVDAFASCPECSAPWRLHWTYVSEAGEKKRRWNTCGLTAEQLAAKWLGDGRSS